MTILPSAGLRARVALDKHGFRTTHSLGQNFLLDDRFLSGLLDEIDVRPEDRVLEIGPGAGVMTALLAERAEKVLAVELDERLAPVLSDVLTAYENASVEYCDFLRCDVDALTARALGGNYRVVANLPYYITADILTKLVGAKNPPASIAIMVQKEAAQRLMSEPGSKQWCALAATVRAYGRAEVVEEVPPERFDPAPHVVSCFLKIDAWDAPIVTPKDEALYRPGGSGRLRHAPKDAGQQPQDLLRRVSGAGTGGADRRRIERKGARRGAYACSACRRVRRAGRNSGIRCL